METGDCFLPCLSVRQSPFSRKDVRRTMNHKKCPKLPGRAPKQAAAPSGEKPDWRPCWRH